MARAKGFFDGWLSVYSDENYRAETLRWDRESAGNQTAGSEAKASAWLDVPSLASIDVKGKWNNRIRSLVTGGSAWVTFYEGANFSGASFRVGPNTTIPALAPLVLDGKGFDRKIGSLQVHWTRPDNWRGSSIADKRGYTLTDVKRASINRTVKSLAESVAGAIPEVGFVTSAIVSACWPFGPKRDDVWMDMSKWVHKLLDDVIGAQSLEDFATASVSALGDFVARYQNSRQVGDFRSLYSFVMATLPRFETTTDPDFILPHIALFGTVALCVYRTARYDYDNIYKDDEIHAINKADDLKDLEDRLSGAITELRRTLAQGVAIAREKRLKKVVSRKDNVRIGMMEKKWKIADEYTGWRFEFKYNNNPHESDLAEKRAAREVDYLQTIGARTFDAEFDVFLEISDIWTYFDLEPKSNGDSAPAFTRKAVETHFGPYGAMMDPPSWNNYAGNHRDLWFTFDAGAKIKTVTLRVDSKKHFVTGIDFQLEGPSGVFLHKTATFGYQISPNDRFGFGSGSEVKVVDLSVARVVSIIGAWATEMSAVVPVTQTFDGEGEAASFAVVNAGPGVDGGSSYAMSGPDGGDAQLVGYSAQVDEHNHLTALGTIWRRDRVVARAR